MKLVLQISEQSTPRKCSVCLQPANLWKFKPNNRRTKRPASGLDLSSRRPVCALHAQIAAA